MKCVVLGAGAWGTTIAHILAHKQDHTVVLWTHELEVVFSCKQQQENTKYLPGFSLHTSLIVTSDLQKALQDADYIFLALPVQYCDAVLQKVAPFITHQQSWIVLSKGVDCVSMQLPSDMIKKHCISNKIALVMGPSFAVDLIQQKLTACVVATHDKMLFKKIHDLLATDYFHLFFTDDVAGVAWSAALKNILALCMGVVQGLGYTENTRAYVLTLGIQELAKIVTVLGGKSETLIGLAGIGDIMLTAYSEKSKNFQAGIFLARGLSVQEYYKKNVTIPESFNTVLIVEKLQKKYNLHLPLCTFLSGLVQGTLPAQDLMQNIMCYN